MPLFGAHMSIAGGLHNALVAAQAHGCDTVQLFTASPQNWQVKPGPAAKTAGQPGKGSTSNTTQWHARPLSDGAVRTFHRALRASGLRCPMAHDCYLINLASPRDDLYRRSVEAFVVEMERAEQLGLRYVIAHPGSHTGTDEETGLRNVARALDEVHRRCRGFRVGVLLETTAGQGQTLGHRFEQLARILDLVAAPERLGVCLDTCHVFAAGYPLGPAAAYEETMDVFDRHIGLKRLRVFHVNDSLRPLGSRVDRHAHIGRGHLGLGPFRLLVNDPRFRDRPMILETPKEEGENEDMDTVNLGVLRSLVAKRKDDPQAAGAAGR
jgi:deoxyribonuclease-4